MSDSQTADAEPDPSSQQAIKNTVDEARAQFANYQEYNKLLRTWFVAFGIGGLVLLYTRPDLLEKLGEVDRDGIIWALLVGSAVQVVLDLRQQILLLAGVSIPNSSLRQLQPEAKWLSEVGTSPKQLDFNPHPLHCRRHRRGRRRGDGVLRPAWR
jgi:hypothetical protein